MNIAYDNEASEEEKVDCTSVTQTVLASVLAVFSGAFYKLSCSKTC